MGGEKRLMLLVFRAVTGSPPHGRGKVRTPIISHFRGGITPAWAGKSRSRSRRCSGARDHPRVGGEKAAPRAQKCEEVGPPPHGRGKDERKHGLRRQTRITPAWAGKSEATGWTTISRRDHPRAGGEKHPSRCPPLRPVGSPPRGRGKGFLCTFHPTTKRITPARAGKSPASQPWSPPLWIMVIRPRP